MSRLIGIDFGTSSTQVSYRNAGGGSTLLNFDLPANESAAGAVLRSFSIPTLISDSRDGRRSFGFDVVLPTSGAEAGSIESAEITYSVKSQVLEAIKLDNPKLHPSYEKIVGFLRYVADLIGEADESLNPLNDDVIVQMSCPVMWSLSARNHLVLAASDAGYRVREGELLDEPISASGAWVNAKGGKLESGKVLLFDMGAGTLDLALVSVEKSETRITAARGNGIAGDHIDDVLVEILSDQISSVLGGVSWRENPLILDGIRNEARLAKESLSRSKQAEYTFESAPIKVTLKDLEASLALPKSQTTRSQQENLGFTGAAIVEIEALLRQAKMFEREQALSTAEIRAIEFEVLRREIDYIVLVGGSTEMWGVRSFIENLFPNAKGIEFGSVDPELLTDAPRLTVALGLAQSENPVSLNDFRPNYSLKFFWEGAPEGITIYEAYSPPFDFKDEWFLNNRVFAARPWMANSPDLGLPTAPTGSNPGGVVAFVKPNGQLIHCDVGGGKLFSGFLFYFGQYCSPNFNSGQAAQIRFTANQEVVMADGQGNRRTILVQHGMRKDDDKYVMNVKGANLESVPENLYEFWDEFCSKPFNSWLEIIDGSTSSSAAAASYVDQPSETIQKPASIDEDVELEDGDIEDPSTIVKSSTAKADALWSLEDDLLLVKSYSAGTDWASAALELERSEQATIARAVLLCKEHLKLPLSSTYVFKEIELEDTQGLETFLRAGLKIEQIALALGLTQDQVFTFGFQHRLLTPMDPNEIERLTSIDAEPSREGAAWTSDEIQTLRLQVSQGLTLADIASGHQRSKMAILRKVYELGGLNDGQLELFFAHAQFD
jgi:hypothetical protein